MQSLTYLYRYGMGPSSSHTMGPRRAAELFCERCTGRCDKVTVHLYGSLSLTGRGHFTDRAVIEGLEPLPCEIVWEDSTLPYHPNGMRFVARRGGAAVEEWTVFSIGGGELREEGQTAETVEVYPQNNLAEMLDWALREGRPLWQLADELEGLELRGYLAFIWQKMQEAIMRGLNTEGALPGGLNYPRKAHGMLARARLLQKGDARTGTLSAFALAVSEENASGNYVVTAPTCGSCGVLPAVLYYLNNNLGFSDDDMINGLAVAGMVGNVVKQNASISGAEVGCQGEVGVACSMAAAAAAQIMGGQPRHVEYAAEMGLEHHLGLTCDPVKGLVQIPCIERNAFAALRAIACAEYALLSDGRHRVGFDQVVEVMKQTGHDLPSIYRETALGGLARICDDRSVFKSC